MKKYFEFIALIYVITVIVIAIIAPERTFYILGTLAFLKYLFS